MIRFTCHNCNRWLEVPPHNVGKNARCPACKAVTIVPNQTVKSVQTIGRKVSCPNCNGSLEVHQQYINTLLECPFCLRSFVPSDKRIDPLKVVGSGIKWTALGVFGTVGIALLQGLFRRR